ncbi:antirestriction protein ArdA, partial [Clostridium sp. AF20-17LB]
KAEPVHSILATLKRFQEAPPAPKKDKTETSHEER